MPAPYLEGPGFMLRTDYPDWGGADSWLPEVLSSKCWDSTSNFVNTTSMSV